MLQRRLFLIPLSRQQICCCFIPAIPGSGCRIPPGRAAAVGSGCEAEPQYYHVPPETGGTLPVLSADSVSRPGSLFPAVSADLSVKNPT